MACECTDKPIPDACNCMVYSGGSFANFYRLVGELIPKDAELSHSHPIVHDDGALEFTDEPPKLSGYKRQGQRLYPVWPDCTLRMLTVKVSTGALTINGLCGNPEAEKIGHRVTLETCQQCKHRHRS